MAAQPDEAILAGTPALRRSRSFLWRGFSPSPGVLSRPARGRGRGARRRRRGRCSRGTSPAIRLAPVPPASACLQGAFVGRALAGDPGGQAVEPDAALLRAGQREVGDRPRDRPRCRARTGGSRGRGDARSPRSARARRRARPRTMRGRSPFRPAPSPAYAAASRTRRARRASRAGARRSAWPAGSRAASSAIRTRARRPGGSGAGPSRPAICARTKRGSSVRPSSSPDAATSPGERRQRGLAARSGIERVGPARQPAPAHSAPGRAARRAGPCRGR